MIEGLRDSEEPHRGNERHKIARNPLYRRGAAAVRRGSDRILPMPRFIVPNSATFHTAKNLLFSNRFFTPGRGRAVLRFHPAWTHLEPIAIAMISAWGAWCRQQG